MWRYSSKSGRFFFVDIGAALSLLPLLFFLNIYTFSFSVASIIVFAIIENMGFPPQVALRYFSARIGQSIGSMSGVLGRSLGPWRIRRALLD